MYAGNVLKRSRKPRDLTALAAAVVTQRTDEATEPDPYAGKNPAAVELGRLGGKKGGKIRAANLSAAKRSEIARHAARIRWESRVK